MELGSINIAKDKYIRNLDRKK